VSDAGRPVQGSGGRPLEGRLVLLGVTGSIAAYKSADLVRRLRDAGADVQVLMSRTATAFIAPLTLETLSGRPVMLDPLELLPDRRIGHIVAADAADAVLVAPATARWLGAMANGLADDVVTATCLATTAPVVVAPAMDGEMYQHPATVANVERLRSFGYAIVEPDEGPLASGAVGRGRLADTEMLVDAVVRAVGDRPVRQPDPASRPPASLAPFTRDLGGWHVVVTAGGTAEPIDPVRFIGNRSSGRMGVAIAAAALERGARVTLIRGMTSVDPPDGAEVIDAPTAGAMRHAVLDALVDADALVMAAAVADFRPRTVAGSKLARADGLTLELEPTEDILAEAAFGAHAGAAQGGRRRPLIVGFAAETGSLDRVTEKAERKRVDLMVANDVSEPGSGFGTDTNRVTFLRPGEAPEPRPMATKAQVAHELLDRLLAMDAERELTGRGASSIA
jgi:phosphopantothenoylcysteine decarboxylase/phosphopantothenate--cysteine ligase